MEPAALKIDDSRVCENSNADLRIFITAGNIDIRRLLARARARSSSCNNSLLIFRDSVAILKSANIERCPFLSTFLLLPSPRILADCFLPLHGRPFSRFFHLRLKTAFLIIADAPGRSRPFVTAHLASRAHQNADSRFLESPGNNLHVMFILASFSQLWEHSRKNIYKQSHAQRNFLTG